MWEIDVDAPQYDHKERHNKRDEDHFIRIALLGQRGHCNRPHEEGYYEEQAIDGEKNHWELPDELKKLK